MPTRLRRVLSIVLQIGVVAAVGAGVLGGVGVLRDRADARAEAARAEPAPLPVSVTRLVREDGYTVEDRFLGRLEPARAADLAFERAGLVVAVLVDEGDAVAAGAPVARLDVAALEAERARLVAQRDQIAAARDLAGRTLARQEALGDAGHASTQRLDEARLAAAVEAARAAEIAAAIARLDIDLDKAILRAPFAGTIAARSVDEGAVVAAGAPVVSLMESAAPIARVGLSPEAAAALAPADRVRLAIGEESLPARLVALRPDLAPATRTVTALFAPDRPPTAAFGTTVALHLPRRVETPGYWLPVAALSEGRRGTWSVLVAEEAGGDAPARVVREAVEVLHVADERAFVRGTLTPGTALVAGGAHRVTPGQAVVLAQAER
ncbi:efflux RND transporter periplasmic adaptor subunit [Salinarimonas rosea]|uniref:efflux RND transporter periplasmic adaptor subunit n=1 Tax=Salinarimonas rosea TaxID=552063 RepID=UPI00048F474B|nr:efflux RND transporter periplasmic adaptor subunit [Salinarimonas rosea]